MTFKYKIKRYEGYLHSQWTPDCKEFIYILLIYDTSILISPT